MATERVIWDRNSSKLWIAGRHFPAASSLNSYITKQGDAVYLMYDIETNNLFCHPAEFTPKTYCFTDPKEILDSYPK
jgi:hypothetical protein